MTTILGHVTYPYSTKSRFEKVIRDAQDSICKQIEEIDGTKFRQDAWTRADGGGGITRVIQGGKVWEKAGVNISVVYGSMPPEAYRCVAYNNVVTMTPQCCMQNTPRKGPGSL